MVKKPFIGQLDRRVRIVKLQTGADGAGGIVTTDQTICECSAAMSEESRNEIVEGKPMNLVKRSYMIRYNANVAANGKDYVVIDGDNRWSIIGVAEIGRKSFLDLTVKIYG